VVDLLRQHHHGGRRFEPREFVESGRRVVVGIAVTDPGWPGVGEVYKVFTFAEGDEEIVLLEDMPDRDAAVATLGD
jgi:hypothetical protein